jgi:hypothetical protein
VPRVIGEYVLVIGSMKSGTTTLFDLLARHPEIAPCRPKEPGFFAFEETWALGFDWYEGLFSGFDPARHCYGLDGSTDYSKHPFCAGVPERLAASAPREFRLIYIMRHPLRRIESHARHVQTARKEVGQFPSPRADHGLDAGISAVSLAAGRYAAQLDRYAALHAEGRVLPLVFEDFVRDQAGTMARVLEFLDLPAAEDAPAGPVHRNRIGEPRRVPGWWETLNRLGPVSTAAKALVPRTLRRGLRDRLKSAPEPVTGRFTLTAQEEGALLEQLSDDLEALRTRYGIDTRAVWGI